MVTKKSPAHADAKTHAQLADTVKESAQQIWLAGLGAFSKAQEEGGKVFETLVKEGMTIQRKTQAAAEEKLSETAHRVADMASDFSARASGSWNRLETVFEERVARALGRLGVPSSHDVDALLDRIDELQASIDQLSGRAATPKVAAQRRATAARKTGARKTPAKRAPRKSS